MGDNLSDGGSSHADTDLSDAEADPAELSGTESDSSEAESDSSAETSLLDPTAKFRYSHYWFSLNLFIVHQNLFFCTLESSKLRRKLPKRSLNRFRMRS